MHWIDNSMNFSFEKRYELKVTRRKKKLYEKKIKSLLLIRMDNSMNFILRNDTTQKPLF